MMLLGRIWACALALSSVACGVALASVVAGAPAPLPHPFGRGHVWFHATLSAPYTFDDTIVRLHFSLSRRIIYGDETAVIRPKRPLRALPFNTLGIHYARITLNGKPVRYAFDLVHQLVDLRLPATAAAHERLSVEFVYWAKPQRGVYFVQPDRYYRNVTPEIWSQGEMIDNRRWFPTWDEPNEKTPSELIVVVPRGWTVVANGYLKSHTHTAATETWDWNSAHRKSTYLIAFAAGPLSKHHTTLGDASGGNVSVYGDGGMNVDSYVQPPDAVLNALCFGRTNDIVAYFQQIIGVKFPWSKYDQTTAERFTDGGMENASATIQTELELHPATEDLEQPCDHAVSHELSHQWWGDDVTMSDWSNIWINEGFARYFQELWYQKHFGEAAFEYERYDQQQRYFGETQQYYRPIVDYVYNDPSDLFDVSGYGRPGEILHSLRWMFGDARFFRALHDYLVTYQYKNANTRQFFAAIGKSLGTDLSWFENEWFYRAAYPHYYVKQTYDAARRTLTLDVTQRNHDGKPFRMPVAIEAYSNGKTIRVEPIIDRNHQIVTMSGVATLPQMVLFDPNNNILRKLTFSKTTAALAFQLAHARHVPDREWALRQLDDLAKANGNRRIIAMRAVREAAFSDPFYGMRADATAVAADFNDASAIDAALHDHDKRVRIAAAGAAGDLTGKPDAIVRDLRALTSDADPNLVAAALKSLGELKAPEAYDELVAALKRPSFREELASGALAGLAAYGDMRAFPMIEARTAYGTQEQERNAAVMALAQLASRASQPQRALPALIELAAHDPLISTRTAATSALGVLGDPAAIPVLQHIELTDSEQTIQAEAWNAIIDIRNAIAKRR